MDSINLIENIALKIKENGGTCYYVGGKVRDRVLNTESDDFDIEVHGISPDKLFEILSLFGKAYSKGSFFGIYAVKGYDIDFALPRSEKAYGNGHRDFEIFTDPNLGIKEAAKRRDFTMNSLYEDVLTHEITDSFGGIADIKNRVIRHIDPESFIEDPLRVLRAAQFSARLDFTIDDDTKKLCSSIDLSSLSKERVEEELRKALLKSKKPSLFFTSLYEMNTSDFWFPEVFALMGIKQNPKYHPEGDAFIHTMKVLDNAACVRDKAKEPYSFMLSALCHDLGKSVTTEIGTDGKIHSYNHESEGISIAKVLISRITENKDIKKYVLNMVKKHMEPNRCAESKSSVKKTNHLFDESLCPNDLILLAQCDALAGSVMEEYIDKSQFLWERLAIYSEYMERPFVTGNDLIESGIIPGEKFTEGLIYAHKLRLAGISKEKALKQTVSFIQKLK